MIDADHPFQCSGCQNRYREARYAARCHKARSTDLRDGSVYVFSEEGEEAFLAADRARWAEEDKAYHYGCSCGESYKSIEAAQDCRKCRTYTEAGRCTEVVDLNTGEIMWGERYEDPAVLQAASEAWLRGIREAVSKALPIDPVAEAELEAWMRVQKAPAKKRLITRGAAGGGEEG